MEPLTPTYYRPTETIQFKIVLLCCHASWGQTAQEFAPNSLRHWRHVHRRLEARRVRLEPLKFSGGPKGALSSGRPPRRRIFKF